MKIQFILVFILSIFFTSISIAESSMRRCTLLPVTDSVGGAIGYKVFEEVEKELKKSNWCTYISNTGLMNIFSKYRENLPLYLKKREILATVGDKLKVGSIIMITLKNEVKGIEAELSVWSENGEDLYFSEKSFFEALGPEMIIQAVNGWLELYSKIIPYDAKINGVLGDQITMDVGKGYPVQLGQIFVVKRKLSAKKHPLLKKIEDWETQILAEGSVTNISDNQALGIIQNYRMDKKIMPGDWVKLKEPSEEVEEVKKNKQVITEEPGTFGVLSTSILGSNSTVGTKTSNSSNRMNGKTLGINFRLEGWVTREYFGVLEVGRGLGTLRKKSGNPRESSVGINNSVIKILGGYKYLPIGFFYGPQIDFYTGYVKHSYDLDSSPSDGFGSNSISGFVLGTGANVPLSREYRFYVQAEFIPFPTFSESNTSYGSANNVNSMELELGIKYQYTTRVTIDGGVEILSSKARFNGAFKEVSFRDDRIKLGLSFNF